MNDEIPQPVFLTAPKAAALCGVSRNTMYTWVQQGKLRAYQTPGRTNLIRPSELVQFMETSGLFVPALLREQARRDEENDRPVNEDSADNSLQSVLVVDDDEATRSLLLRGLVDEYRVFQAETGYEALHLLTLRPEIDLVLLDLHMPGQHGRVTLEEIRQLRPDVKVVIVSGYAGEMSEAMRENGQVDSILHKPIALPELRGRVREILLKKAEGK